MSQSITSGTRASYVTLPKMWHCAKEKRSGNIERKKICHSALPSCPEEAAVRILFGYTDYYVFSVFRPPRRFSFPRQHFYGNRERHPNDPSQHCSSAQEATERTEILFHPSSSALLGPQLAVVFRACSPRLSTAELSADD